MRDLWGVVGLVFRKGSIVKKWLETDPSMEKLRSTQRIVLKEVS